MVTIQPQPNLVKLLAASFLCVVVGCQFVHAKSDDGKEIAIYVATKNGIREYNSDGQYGRTIQEGLNRPGFLEVDKIRRYIYWSEKSRTELTYYGTRRFASRSSSASRSRFRSTPLIMRSKLDGYGKGQVTSGTEHFVLFPHSKQTWVFFVKDLNAHRGAIYLLRPDEASPKPEIILQTEGTPLMVGMPLLVAREDRSLYWYTADMRRTYGWLHTQSIRRSTLEGTNQTTVASRGVSNKIVDLALAPRLGFLYWLEDTLVGSAIRRVPIGGGEEAPVEIRNVKTEIRGLDIDEATEQLYWSERNRVRRSNINGGNVRDVMINPVPGGVFDVEVVNWAGK